MFVKGNIYFYLCKKKWYYIGILYVKMFIEEFKLNIFVEWFCVSLLEYGCIMLFL